MSCKPCGRIHNRRLALELTSLYLGHFYLKHRDYFSTGGIKGGHIDRNRNSVSQAESLGSTNHRSEENTATMFFLESRRKSACRANPKCASNQEFDNSSVSVFYHTVVA